MPDEQAVQNAQMIAFALVATAAIATCVLRHHGTLARNASNSACLALAVAGAASAIAGESLHVPGNSMPSPGNETAWMIGKAALLGALWTASESQIESIAKRAQAGSNPPEE